MPRLIPASKATAADLQPAPAKTRPATVCRRPRSDQFQIRTSERRSFKRCQYRWKWGYMDGLKPLREANPLWFGQAVHIALAEWYMPGKSRGVHPAVTFDKILEGDRQVRIPDAEYESDIAEFVSAKKLGLDMLNRYVDTFGPDEDWEIIQPEFSFQVFFDGPNSEKNWLQYNGTFDGVMRYTGESTGEMTNGSIWLLEHKTAASIQVHHLPLDDQAGSYWALAEDVLRAKDMIEPHEKIEGIMYNFLRKVPEDPRPQNEHGMYTNQPVKQHYLDALTKWAKANENRKMPSAKMQIKELAEMADEAGLQVLGDVSKQQPAPYFERIPVFRSRGERATMLQRIRDEAQHIESARSDRPLLPLIKNPTKDCAWDCEFFRMCQLHEAGADWVEFRDTMFKTWSPYEDHEIKAA